MKFVHLHIQFKKLEKAVEWMGAVLAKEPACQNPNMAVFAFGHTSLIFDKGDEDLTVTIAFDSDNCDADFERLKLRGGVVTESPADQPWGVRAAYFQGPGKTSIELEQEKK